MNSFLVVLCALFTAAVGRPGYLHNELTVPVAISHQSRIDVIQPTPILTPVEDHHELIDDAHSAVFETIEDLPSLTQEDEHITLQEQHLGFADSEALVHHQEIPLFEDDLHLNHGAVVDGVPLFEDDLHLNHEAIVEDAPLFEDDLHLNLESVVEDAPLFEEDLHLNHGLIVERAVILKKGLDKHSFTHPLVSTVSHEVPLILVSKSPELEW